MAGVRFGALALAASIALTACGSSPSSQLFPSVSAGGRADAAVPSGGTGGTGGEAGGSGAGGGKQDGGATGLDAGSGGVTTGAGGTGPDASTDGGGAPPDSGSPGGADGSVSGADGSAPISCSSDAECAGFKVDQCQRAVCDLNRGTCDHGNLNDGTPCDDKNLCTQADACQAGTCIGDNPVVCRPSDQCHVAGTCNPNTGQCTDLAKADGTACNDGLVCTAFDVCTAGACSGTAVVCDDGIACTVDSCSETNGGCVADPTACPCATDPVCDDGNACNGAEKCNTVTKTCRNGTPIDCSKVGDDCNVGTCNPSTGACTASPKSDGTACDDGNTCTQTDTCQKGACTGVNPIVCFAVDSCHGAGTCDATTGQCSSPALANGSACSDGNPCTQLDTCQNGICIGTNPVTCVAIDSCHKPGLCNPLDGLCTSPSKTNGTPCDDSDACTQVDTCQNGSCTGASPVACTALDQCHVAGTCNPASGQCDNPASSNGTTCNDGNACTQTDTCQAGFCKGANPVACAAADQCHTAGACDPSTGQCSSPSEPDGFACNDGNACTQTDTCVSGVCKGGSAVVCTALDQCHTPGTCNSADGTCSNPPKGDGTSCDDGNACTQSDSCQGGVCVGGNPVQCSAQDQCHTAGTCNPANGACSNPQKGNGSTCDDGLACTKNDVCTAGVCGGAQMTCNDGIACTIDSCSESQGGCVADKSNCPCVDDTKCDDKNPCNGVETCDLGTLTCKGGTPVDCSTSSNACNVGTCNPSTGQCAAVAKVNGTPCNDGNACTLSDSCQAGVCTGANPVACTALDQCHTAGTCNAANGTCSNPPKQDGTACDDASACTQSDTCQSGVCTGANPVTCTAQDQCHVVGSCDPGTGNCGNPAKSDGSSCDDGNACSGGDSCQGGTCTGQVQVACGALDQCHVAGTCNPGTGKCTNPPKQDGTACDDTDACTKSDTCQTGSCVGATPVICAAQDQCHLAGVCNSANGVCSNPAKGNGSACDDGNACTQTDSCLSGACKGANLVVCSVLDQCHVVGKCLPATGVCSNPTKADGAACNDGNACTPTESCQAGLCTGTDVCSVTITPSVLSLLPDDAYGFTAVVSGTPNQFVTWSVDEGMPAGGVVDSSGAYVAPSALGTYHVRATSVADPTQSAVATITVTKTPVAVSICPATTTLLMDDTMIYTAMVAGTANQAVTWSVSGPSGATITAAGLFTPSSAGIYTITAVSQAEPAKQATATANVVVETLPSISGTVSYAGSKKGRIYVFVQTWNNGATTMLVPGKYRVRNVQSPNQPVKVFAFRDTIGNGTYVAGVDPSGYVMVDWTGTDPGNVDITLVDPTPPPLVAPSGAFVAPGDGLALVGVSKISNVTGDDLPDHYRVYAGLDSSVGPSSNVMMREYGAGNISVALLAPLTNGIYWFAVAGVRGGVVGPTTTVGPYTVGPQTGGSTISGTVKFSGVSPTGPLYVLVLPSGGKPQAVRYTPSGAATQQAFTVPGVGDGVYELVALLDQADDGEISTTDPANYHASSTPYFTVQGADVSGLTTAITGADSLAKVTTVHDAAPGTDSYGLRMRVGSNTKQVVKVAFTSGPGLSAPTDFAANDYRGNDGEFQWETPKTAAIPTIGGVYTVDVTTDDGITCSQTMTVTNVLMGLPTAVSPSGSGGTKPTFTWLAPTPAPSVFFYDVSISPQGPSTSPTWQYQMPSSALSVVYDVDGNAGASALTSGTTYSWSISALDPLGNEARSFTTFTVP